MNTLLIGQQINSLIEFLERQGFTIEELNDPFEINGFVAGLDKPYITPMSSPLSNDFSVSNYCPLVLRQAGEPVMMGCARLEDLAREGIDTYWSRIFIRAYSADGNDKVIGNVRAKVKALFNGRSVYFGDLFVSRSFRGSRLALRAFVAIGHLVTTLRWDANQTYCFIRERDILRGAAALYRFNQLISKPFDWLIEPSTPRGRSEVLAYLDAEDIHYHVASVVEAIRRQNALRTTK